MKSEKRYFDRKPLDPLAIQGLMAIGDLTPISDGGHLVEASPSGFRLIVHRKELCDPIHRDNLNIEDIVGLQVSLFIPAMDLDISGIIARTRYCGGHKFEIGIDYTSDAPEYWRECLCDLLPNPGELNPEE